MDMTTNKEKKTTKKKTKKVNKKIDKDFELKLKITKSFVDAWIITLNENETAEDRTRAIIDMQIDFKKPNFGIWNLIDAAINNSSNREKEYCDDCGWSVCFVHDICHDCEDENISKKRWFTNEVKKWFVFELEYPDATLAIIEVVQILSWWVVQIVKVWHNSRNLIEVETLKKYSRYLWKVLPRYKRIFSKKLWE